MLALEGWEIAPGPLLFLMVPLPSFLTGNPIVQGGAMLGIAGGLFASIKSYPSRLIGWFRYRFIVTVVVRSRDNAFTYVMSWLARHPYGRKTKNLTLTTDWINGVATPVVRVGVGKHLVTHKGKKLWIDITREEPKDKFSEAIETITINSFQGGRRFIEDFIREIWDEEFAVRQNSIPLFRYDPHAYDGPGTTYWSLLGYTDKRPVRSLVYNNGIVEDLLRDIQSFTTEKTWYDSMHIPHTRGYLLYGEPGNGKSSLIRAVATELGWSICFVNINNSHFSDDQLQRALASVPEKTLVVFEDIDCLFNSFNAPAAKQKNEDEDDDDEGVGFNRSLTNNSITFSGLLNAMDGIFVTPTRIIFMTTNRKELLDKALLRPGRLDKKIYIGNATRDQIARMYVRFFGEDTQSAAVEFANQFEDGQLSMANLQEKLLELKEQKRK